MMKSLYSKLGLLCLTLGITFVIGCAADEGEEILGETEEAMSISDLRELAINYVERTPLPEFATIRARNLVVRSQFNWGTDGCSTPHWASFLLDDDYRKIFFDACTRHDFGYRNLGGVRGLDRSKKDTVDNIFLNDMKKTCADRESKDGADACEPMAKAYYEAVRRYGGF